MEGFDRFYDRLEFPPSSTPGPGRPVSLLTLSPDMLGDNCHVTSEISPIAKITDTNVSKGIVFDSLGESGQASTTTHTPSNDQFAIPNYEELSMQLAQIGTDLRQLMEDSDSKGLGDNGERSRTSSVVRWMTLNQEVPGSSLDTAI